MISIIDYGAGNLMSVQKALAFLGFSSVITEDKDEILSSSGVILPGVGSFGDAMRSLRTRGLENIIYDCITKKKPFLGICLGLQLLFEGSEESEGISGLGIFKGTLQKIPKTGTNKIPHMGWNSLDIHKTSGIFKDIPQNTYVYFVHSYYISSPDRSIAAATTEYGTVLDVAVEHENVSAVQFHPEKSSGTGLKILNNFADISPQPR